jgi:diphthamide synthase (EF-2-diphthine--ammonia ligase)
MSDKREPQTLSPSDKKLSKKTAISWTGGKDCNLALLSAWRDERFDVVCLLVVQPEEADFMAHPLPLMEEQARCLGLPLHHIVLKKKSNPTKTNMSRA